MNKNAKIICFMIFMLMTMMFACTIIIYTAISENTRAVQKLNSVQQKTETVSPEVKIENYYDVGQQKSFMM